MNQQKIFIPLFQFVNWNRNISFVKGFYDEEEI